MYALICKLASRPTDQEWDLVSGLLYQFHSQGIEEGEEPPPEGDRSLVTANEFELALEPGVLLPPEKFTAYFENLRDAERAERAVEPVLAHLTPVFEVAEIEEKNYAEIYRENFHPIEVAPHWFIRASWHAPAPKGRIELLIEPGMAFGTGAHETTKACLELIAHGMSRVAKPTTARVLDFGCGSGILAIALKKLGAGSVHAVDIDPLAMEATKQNAARNSVEVKASLDSPGFEDLDGIVANILKNTLLEFAPLFSKWLKPGGFLILSGLLLDQEEAITKAYTALGFAVDKRICQNNWVSFLLVK